jgi:periplasmic copper chaperone A
VLPFSSLTDQDFLMKLIRNAAFAASLAVAAIAVFGARAFAHGYTLGDLVIGHPWTRATAPAARVAAGYLTVENRGAAPDRLVSATFSAAGVVEVHEMSMDGSVMKMRELPKGIEIRPGQKLELKPGGFHLMFIDLKAGLKEGESIKGVLVFETAGRIEVDFKVDSMGARGGGHEDHRGHGAPARTN